MRINLTKKEIINSLYMQIGFSKKTSENLLEDIIDTITKNLKKYVIFSKTMFGEKIDMIKKIILVLAVFSLDLCAADQALASLKGLEGWGK